MTDTHACCVCGEPNAPYGLGPPLKPAQGWYCAAHWQREAATQTMFVARLRALMEDDVGSADATERSAPTEEDKATWVFHPGPACRCPNCASIV